MKKVLSTVLALGLVAGVASTAAAAYDSFSIRGFYTLDGYYLENGLRGEVDLQDGSSSWYAHSSRLYPELTINDKTRFKSELRLLDQTVWGSGTASGSAGLVSNPDGVRNMDINKLYMEYDSPFGMIRAGRIPFGTYGVSSWNNSATRNDGFIFATNFLPKPMALTFAVTKQTEDDFDDTTIADQDKDWYSVHFDYKTDTLVAGTRLIYIDDATGGSDTTSTTTITPGRPPVTTTTITPAGVQRDDMRLQGYAKYNMDNLFFEGEFDYMFGDTETDNGSDGDLDAYAFMLSAGGDFGALNAAITWSHVSGDDDTTDNTDDSYGDAGNDWQPLLILTNERTGLLNNKDGVSAPGVQEAGHNLVFVNFGYKVSDKLSLNSLIGTGWAEDEMDGWEDDLGWEVNLGASYKLLDNLTYSAKLGYLDAGDFLTEQGTGTSVTEEDSVVMVTNSLNMSF